MLRPDTGRLFSAELYGQASPAPIGDYDPDGYFLAVTDETGALEVDETKLP